MLCPVERLLFCNSTREVRGVSTSVSVSVSILRSTIVIVHCVSCLLALGDFLFEKGNSLVARDQRQAFLFSLFFCFLVFNFSMQSHFFQLGERCVERQYSVESPRDGLRKDASQLYWRTRCVVLLPRTCSPPTHTLVRRKRGCTSLLCPLPSDPSFMLPNSRR